MYIYININNIKNGWGSILNVALSLSLSCSLNVYKIVCFVLFRFVSFLLGFSFFIFVFFFFDSSQVTFKCSLPFLFHFYSHFLLYLSHKSCLYIALLMLGQ